MANEKFGKGKANLDEKPAKEENKAAAVVQGASQQPAQEKPKAAAVRHPHSGGDYTIGENGDYVPVPKKEG